MSRVLEVSGAQVLPPVADSRATVSPWFAHLACDADLRRHAVFVALADSLEVVS